MKHSINNLSFSKSSLSLFHDFIMELIFRLFKHHGEEINIEEYEKFYSLENFMNLRQFIKDLINVED